MGVWPRYEARSNNKNVYAFQLQTPLIAIHSASKCGALINNDRYILVIHYFVQSLGQFIITKVCNGHYVGAVLY